MSSVIQQQQQKQQQQQHAPPQSLRRSRSHRLTVTDDFWVFPLDDALDLPTHHHLPVEAHPEVRLMDNDEIYLHVEDLKGYDHINVDRIQKQRRQRWTLGAATALDYSQRLLPRLELPSLLSSPPTAANIDNIPPKRRSWLLSFALPKSQMELPWDFLKSDDECDDCESSLPGLTTLPDDSSSETSSASSDEQEMCSITSSCSYSTGSSRKSVSFVESVIIHPIPHSSTLTLAQRQRMYASSTEVRQNKSRSKREFRYDGCDWRNATEEWEMGIDMVTGELVHPVHEQQFGLG